MNETTYYQKTREVILNRVIMKITKNYYEREQK